MIQTCVSILAGALAGVAVYNIQKRTDKTLQTSKNHSSFQDEQDIGENKSSCS